MFFVASKLRLVEAHVATLLGSPIGSTDRVDSTIRAKKKALEVLEGRLKDLYAHDALACSTMFSHCRICCILHSSLCFLSPELEMFDYRRDFC